MNAQPIHVLLIEDNPNDAELVELFLDQGLAGSFVLDRAARLSTALRKLAQGGFDVVLLDLLLPDSAGLSTFRRVHAAAGEVPIVVFSGADSDQDALTAVRMGAQDYLIKGKTDARLLARSVRFALVRKHAPRQHWLQPARSTQELGRIAERFPKLSPRERQILEQLANGHSLKQIALALGTSYYTVKNQRASILRKLDARSDTDLVRMVMVVRFGEDSLNSGPGRQ
jgi:DNA-binding NarL/FixJ family response regulator